MSEKNDEAAKKAAAEKAEKEKADKEAAKLLAKENADLKKKLADADKQKTEDDQEIADLSEASKAKKGGDGKPKDQASQFTEPVPQPGDPAPNADRVVVGKLFDGERFYGEDFGEGKLVDRYTGKEVVMSSVEKTIKVVDPQNPKVMRPKKIIVPVYKLKK